MVGCGAIARAFHVPALLRHRDAARHLILVDRDVERARALAAEFGVERTADNYLDVLPDVDGIVVTVPHHLHYRIAMDCLRAGKHVLCEKPLSEAPQEARELVAAADAAGVTLGGQSHASALSGLATNLRAGPRRSHRQAPADRIPVGREIRLAGRLGVLFRHRRHSRMEFC